jgi:DNA repair protein RadC
MKLPEIEISIRYKGTKKADLKQIKTSADVHEVCKMLFDQSTIDWTEEVVLLCLSQAKKLLGYYKVSSGGIAGTVLDARVVFTTALNCAGTTSIILAHNHPSGNLNPSPQDDNMTRKIADAGELLDITLLDHLIVTSDGYYSYLDEGRL